MLRLGGGLDGIVDQIEHDLLQLDWIA